MKIKIKLFITLIILVYIGGFISGRLMKPFRPMDVQKTEILSSKVDLQKQHQKDSDAYLDSANAEMLNFSIRYYHLSNDLLPNRYMTYYGDTITYNKENFYYYYSMYKITDYLSKSKSLIINNLIIEKDSI